MQIPNSFRKALWKAYTGKTTLDDLIKDQEHLLRGLARYALRFRTAWYMSDEDDLFQEACIWMIKCMWDWDEDRGTDLAEYVIYNVGVKLNTQIKIERAKKRHPDPNRSRIEYIWDQREFVDKTHTHSNYESVLDSHHPNPETITALREAIEIANQNLTDLAKDLLFALADNNGNLTHAARDMLKKEHIRRRFGDDEIHLKYVLRQKVMSEIFQFLDPTHIIPVT